MPRPVIAVFGSNKPAEGESQAAELLGQAIARHGAIVLSGGSWPTQIKDVAIVAAGTIPAAADFPVWIGVANKPDPAPPKRHHRGIILTPGGGHERNFVEACLCHAAIALGDSDGTSSEALFSLFLKRPTSLVNYPREPQLPEIAGALKAAALDRVDPPKDLEPVRWGIRQAYKWADSPDGVRADRFLEVRVFPGRDGVTLHLRDVTALRRAEYERHRIEARFRSLVQESSDLILILSRKAVIEFASPAVERMLGFRPDEIVGRRDGLSVHPADEKRFRRALIRVLRSPGTHPPFEIRVQHGDGSYRWLEVTPTNLLADPLIHGVVANCRDITERHASEFNLWLLSEISTVVGASLDLSRNA